MVVDDFGVKFIGKHQAKYLQEVLEKYYKAVSVDWKVEIYCGIKLQSNYDKGYVNTSMPG